MILTAIQAFFEALKSGFSYAETAKENQCETEVLKEKDIKRSKMINRKIYLLIWQNYF